ncbi:MAG TPA: hypothetical protein VG013_17945 [Gemmataceae bacterium]|nr:hypothetical protein [Gemmataceae bacterium]
MPAFVVPDNVKCVCQPGLQQRITIERDGCLWHKVYTSDDLLTGVLEQVEAPR